jgi:hypothetical protein
MQVRFIHAAPHRNGLAELHQLFRVADNALQAAVCYATAPGISSVFANALPQLNKPESFFVAGVDLPTSIDGLASLHFKAPGHVYIHLGWVTPRTKDESREHGNALMHSKVLLAEGAQGCRLWVGSHNLTARALGGANLEAAVIVEGTMQDQPLADARLHLLHCRDTAELFDPKRIPEYKAIQERRAQPPPGLSKDPVLVIHATVPADWQPPSAPFRVHLSLVPMLFDNYFDVDRQCDYSYTRPVLSNTENRSTFQKPMPGQGCKRQLCGQRAIGIAARKAHSKKPISKSSSRTLSPHHWSWERMSRCLT